nr:MAG TPA: hypothetical protein [Caudoviricetes sp.]
MRRHNGSRQRERPVDDGRAAGKTRREPLKIKLQGM